MDFAYLTSFEKRKQADALLLPFWREEQRAEPAHSLTKECSLLLRGVLATGDFKGKEGELLYLYVEGEPEKRVCLLGLGAKNQVTVENLRRSYGSFTKSCLNKRLKSVNLIPPESERLSEEALIRGITEGLLLANYVFHPLKHRDPEEPEETLLQKITWIGSHAQVLARVRDIALICEAVDYARNLVNGNADEITPQYLAQSAQEMAKKHPSIKTTLFDKKRIEKEALDLLLAVNRGSALDPALIIMEYRGNVDSDEHTILVGKGVTYDTGGLNLKPTGSMETMKCDMAGGAACLGVMLAVSQLALKVNVTIVVPTTENGIDAKSFKPGDVYRSYSGKTVEMTNSDAEGRLILADALAYAVKNLHPTRIIDIATLTGAIEIALGSEAAGLMSPNDELADLLQKAGEATFERVWRMPLFDEYQERLKSEIADDATDYGVHLLVEFLQTHLTSASSGA